MSENDFIIDLMDKSYATTALLFCINFHDCDRELFEKQFKKKLVDGFNVNYKVPHINIFDDWPAGCTLLHLIDCNSLRQFIIAHGGDCTATNKEGSTILHKQVTSTYNYYSRRYEIYRLQEEELVDIVMTAHIKTRNANNPKSQHGLTHFHLTCMYNNVEGVNFFLENGVPVNETVNSNSTFCPGYSALHFAAEMCAVETAELLLKWDANVNLQDAKGRNPLDALIVERIKMFVLLKRLSRIADRDMSSYSNIQGNYDKNQRLMSLFLERIDKRSSDLLSLIHLICTGENSRIRQLIDRNEETFAQLLNTSLQALHGFTPMHFAALFSVETLELLMEKGASLDAKDTRGVTPFDLCLRGFNAEDTQRILSLRPDYSSVVFSNGKTKLSDFIHAMREETATFDYFLRKNLTQANMYVPFGSPVCAGYTPLHLTIIRTEQPPNWSWKRHDSTKDLFANFQSEESQKYLSRIDSCLRYNPDVTSRDARGSTPLHRAFELNESHVVHRLLQRHETSSDYVDEFGLSHLQIACAAKDEALVKKLVRGGANVNQVAELGYTWLDVLSPRPNYHRDEVIKYFVNEGSTPLHFAVAVECPKAVVQILVDREEVDVLARDAEGLTPLERLLGVPIFVEDREDPAKKYIDFGRGETMQVAELLVRKMTDAQADGMSMMYCYSLLDSELLKKLCRFGDESLLKLFDKWGVTALHVACFNRDVSQVLASIDEIDANARVNPQSALWPGCTPLHLFASSSPGDDAMHWTIAEILLQRGADVAARNVAGQTPLVRMFEWHSPGSGLTKRYLKLMLEYLRNFDADATSSNGFTHLHIASAVGAVSVVEKMLEQGARIDQPTDYFTRYHGGYTALHFAVAYRQRGTLELLLKRGADVGRQSTYDENALHVACQNAGRRRIQSLRSLFGAGADVDARNARGETPLEALIESGHAADEEIEFFLRNVRRVDSVNPVSGQGLLATALNKRPRLPAAFEMLVKAPDVKIIDDDGRNAIHHIVAFQPPFDPPYSAGDINMAFTPAAEYVDAIGSLIKLGLDIDLQDCKGMTPLHLAAQMQNITGIVGLLDNGADINITDADGKPAFAYSLELAELSEGQSHLDLLIFKAASGQRYKLNLFRIGVSETNRRIDMRMHEIRRFDVPNVEKCYDEVETMDEHINEQSVKYYELLPDTGAVSAFPYMVSAKQEAIDYVFKNEVENLRVKFPVFTGVLLLQYRKALRRCRIVKAAFTSLDLLLGFHMPAVCSRIIFGFLSNDELCNLNSSTTILA